MQDHDAEMKGLVRSLDAMTAHLYRIWSRDPARHREPASRPEPRPESPYARQPQRVRQPDPLDRLPGETFFGWIARVVRGRGD